MIRTVIFDLGGVIVPLDFPSAYKRLAAISGFPVEEIPDRIRATDVVVRFECGKVSPVDFHRELSDTLSLDIAFDEFTDVWCALFPPHDLIPAEWIEQIRQQNKRVLLLSNTNPIHFGQIRQRYPHLEHFDHYVLSYEVGIMKPNSAIYEAAIAQSGCAADECFFTDDVLPYVEGARRSGIDAEQFLGAEKLRADLAARVLPSAHELIRISIGQTGFAKLMELARGHKKHVVLVMVLSFLSTAADLANPLIYREAINDVAGLFIQQQVAGNQQRPTPPAAGEPAVPNAGALPNRTVDETLNRLIIAVILLFTTSVLGYFFSLRSDYYGALVASRIESDLIVNTFRHVLRLPLDFFSRRPSAGLAKRINQSDEVAPIVHAFSQQIAPEAVRLVGICAIMLSQNWEMTLICMSMLPPYLWIARRSALRMRTGLEPYYEMWENISARIADAIGAIKTVKLSGAEEREQDRLARESTTAYGVYLNRIRTGHRFYISQSVLSHLSRSLVLGYGGYLVLKHQLTPGDVVMFVSYLDRLYSPIDALNGLAVALQNNLVSLERAVGLLEAGPPEAIGGVLPPGPGKVEFRNVRFGYVPERDVLKNISFTLEPGHITGIVGPSGAGKTTAADLLLKLFQPSAGEIYIDGHATSDYSPSAIRAAIGVVAADGAVFRGTLADNIRYKSPGASDQDVKDAALAAGLGRLLERLPDGIETEIGERGIGLSVGERQRLQIARMLADKPRLLVLDEATANLDYATETEVRGALSKLTPRPTMLIIAHRYTMVKDADHVIVLQDGSIVEEGPPDRLIAHGGWFAELAKQSGEQSDESECAIE